MNNIIKSITAIVLMLICCQTASAIAVNQKNLHLQIVAYPSGSGTVYADVKTTDHAFVKENSGWGETTTLKATLEQNGSDCNGWGMYEAMLKAEPAEGYEFVCYSYECYENPKAIYLVPDILVEASTWNADTRQFTPATLANGVFSKGAILNVNTAARNDGNSNDHSREELFRMDNWSPDPDLVVYAVFRKVGERYPTIDIELGIDDVVVSDDDMSNPDTSGSSPHNGRTYNLQGMEVDAGYKGIVIRNGRKFINK